MDLQQQLRLAAAMLQMQHAAASITVPPAVPPTFALTPPNENSPPQDARRQQQPTTPPGEQIELRQFLLQMLQEDGNRHLIRWTNKEEGMFKVSRQFEYPSLFQFFRPLLHQQHQPLPSPQQFSIDGLLGLNQNTPEDVSDTSSENVNPDSPHTPPIVEEFDEPGDNSHSN
ncbi:hypothetical protein PRIPAC_90066 [Pristionchus pacificus]|uniref:ETS domain-containing protein n=1 Tax=Pristionchus pacificus TaxID=54126 RepID=A0A2A6B3V9_PRIPA|nr:hypothetical protein PRIPAC_90066 [Pristionchus pacificus]|eukprot:PDM60562.1 hypothetical protein PRIPAC_53540 [Pristionchus pacificus]